MTKQKLDIQKQLVEVFEELKTKVKELDSETMLLGWKQRNALITHVYSEYTKHEILDHARRSWDKNLLERNVHKWLYDKMVEHRDEWGYFENYIHLIAEIEEIYTFSINREEYEIASILKIWIKKLTQSNK